MQVAIRDACLAQAGYAAAGEGLADLGVSLVEVAIDAEGRAASIMDGRAVNLTDPAQAAAFRAETEAAGIRVCALLCSQDFNSAERERHLRWVTQAVQAAEALGAPALRVDSAMSGQDALSLDERVRVFSDAVTEVLRRTPGSEVALGIENHGRQGNDPEWMHGVIRRVGSPRLGLTLDIGNWYWWGHPLSRVYEIYAEFAPLVKATHVKNIAYPAELREQQRPIGYEYGRYCCPLAEGDLDIVRVARILKDGGYLGPLTIEDESLGKAPEPDRKPQLRADVQHLEACIRRAGG